MAERKVRFMAQSNSDIGNFHFPSTDSHPKDSVGNQQVFDNGQQVGSLEYKPDPIKGFKISINTIKGKEVVEDF